MPQHESHKSTVIETSGNDAQDQWEAVKCCDENLDSNICKDLKTLDINNNEKNRQVQRENRENQKIPVKFRVIECAAVKKSSSEDKSMKHENIRPEIRKTDPKLVSEAQMERKAILKVFHDCNVPYIDSHCHTDYIVSQLKTQKSKTKRNYRGLTEWMDDFPTAFPKCFAGIIANFVKPARFVFSKEMEEQFGMEWISRELLASNYYLGTTWGCHPHEAQRWGRSKAFWTILDRILSNASKWKVVAVGECGIDLHRCESELEIQKMVFEKHVELAFNYKLPLVIHCRNGAKGDAETETLRILKKKFHENDRNLKIHRHCFTESWDIARTWMRLCPEVHFGFTAAIFSFKEAQIEAVRQIPLDRILIETDAPYFKPKHFESVDSRSTALPGMAISTAYRISEIKGLELEEVLRATYNNTRRLYQIPAF